MCQRPPPCRNWIGPTRAYPFVHTRGPVAPQALFVYSSREEVPDDVLFFSKGILRPSGRERASSCMGREAFDLSLPSRQEDPGKWDSCIWKLLFADFCFFVFLFYWGNYSSRRPAVHYTFGFHDRRAEVATSRDGCRQRVSELRFPLAPVRHGTPFDVVIPHSSMRERRLVQGDSDLNVSPGTVSHVSV